MTGSHPVHAVNGTTHLLSECGLANAARRALRAGFDVQLSSAHFQSTFFSFLSCSFSLCPKSVPKCGSDFVPVILTGSSVPAPFLLKKGSTGFSRIDFQPVTMCESVASKRAIP